jgi:VWFA-related protein
LRKNLAAGVKDAFATAAIGMAMLSLAGTAVEARAQQTQQPGAQQAQPVPDAPGPQVPALGAVAPGKGTTPTYSGVTPTPPAADDGEAAPGTSLPGTAPQSADKQLGDDEEQTDAPTGNLQTLVLRTRFVDVPFTVKDSKGNLVPGLTWRDVRVYENNVRQHISVFTVDPFPLSVALVIDQTLPTDAMTRVNNSLAALQGAFAPYDAVAVLTYTNQVHVQTDFTGGTSPRLAAVVERSKGTGRESASFSPGETLGRTMNINDGAQDHINPLTSGGPGSPIGVAQVQREGHPLNDAILAAAKVTTEAGPGRRRIVYVISDGKEYGSAAKEKDVIKYLQANQIAVYATIVGDSSLAGMGFIDHLHIPLFMQDNVLPRYTSATGGQAYAEFRTPGIEKSFARITEQVRNQYTVGYYTNSKESELDGKFRSIDVRVLRPHLTVIAKAGYYPQAAPVRTRPAPSATPSKPATTPGNTAATPSKPATPNP